MVPMSLAETFPALFTHIHRSGISVRVASEDGARNIGLLHTAFAKILHF
jgi:hypothetical protein